MDEACRKLLTGMSNQDNEQLLAWANSQERLNNYPPDPQLNTALGQSSSRKRLKQTYLFIYCFRMQRLGICKFSATIYQQGMSETGVLEK
jgi:hypothetical protein